MTTLEAAQAYLKQELKDGKTLHNHLAETVLKVLSERPSENHELFEHLSAAVKDTPAKEVPVQDTELSQQAKDDQAKWVEKSRPFFPKAVIEGEEPADEGEPKETQNLPEEMKYFEDAGVSIGKIDMYILHKSIQKLAAVEAANSMRFWGKICGTQADYYIAEAENEAIEIPEEFADVMENEQGSNKHSYWVCSFPGAAWEKLELLHPAQVVAARKLKKFFTGNLNAKVTGYPPFSVKKSTGEIITWKERHLLRAQIARISSACVLSPAGVFERDEDDPVTMAAAEPSEDAKPIENTDFISDLENWRHHHLENNKLGRCLKKPDAETEDGDIIVDKDAPLQKPALEPILEAGYCDNIGSISDCWAIRKCNNVIAVRNLNWPGAVALGWAPLPGTPNVWRFGNVYVGYGTKFAPKPYTPPAPPTLQMEYTPPAGTDDKSVLCEEESDHAILKDPRPLEEEEEEEEDE